ncbi:class I glutamine amidotransferase-like protein [Fomes fomentarius]|nr:class I glutamine amidotransferase-like protein [Fomes fomentarius]
MSQQAQGSQPSLPTKAGLLVFPGFEPLDAFGPIEALYMLSWLRKFDLYVIAPTLEAQSSGIPDPRFNVHGSDFGVRIAPTHTFDNVPEDLEVLLVPGGIGASEFGDIEPIVQFLQKTYPKLKYLITVCNGAGLPAKAGILDGKRATTNKMLWKRITAMGPKANWVKTARFVVDGNIWTCGGVSAGIDGTLAWIAHVYGTDTARTIANQMEYEWRDDKNWDPFAYMFDETSVAPSAFRVTERKSACNSRAVKVVL